MKFYDLKLFLAALLAIFTFTACSKKAVEENSEETTQENSQFYGNETLEIQNIEGQVYIAIAAPLTGPYRELGNSILEGATIAVEEFNKDSKTKVGTIVIDDGGIVSEGIARANLISEQNALGVIGHLNSSITIETSNIYARNKIATISPASTSPKLTERPNIKGFVFRTIGTDRQLGDIAAKFVKNNKQFKNIAVLYNDRPYGISVASEFVREIAKSADQRLVFYQTIPVRTDKHEATAKKVAKTEPDLVFFIGEYNDAGYLVKALKKEVPDAQFVGAEGIHHKEFIKIAGTDSEGTIVIGPKTSDDPQFNNRFSQRFGRKPSGYVSSSYRATMLLLNAIKENNFRNSEAVAVTLSKSDIFDPNGDLIDSGFSIYQVKDSEFVNLKS
jgi:branched-chain amino acid transport system substrate-binding protein